MRGKVLDYRVPVSINHLTVQGGDLLFGDDEGVLVIPQAVEQEAIEKALEKANTENAVADAIRDGMDAVKAFETFGVI